MVFHCVSLVYYRSVVCFFLGVNLLEENNLPYENHNLHVSQLLHNIALSIEHNFP